MQTSVKSEYVKRTQKDYSLSFKLQVVEEIKQAFWFKIKVDLYGVRFKFMIKHQEIFCNNFGMALL
jgi:hypothetical protein